MEYFQHKQLSECWGDMNVRGTKELALNMSGKNNSNNLSLAYFYRIFLL